MNKSLLIAISLFLFISIKANAQKSVADSSINAPLISIHYGFNIPGGDLAKRFGNNSAIGGGFFYKTKRNILFGVEASYLFGTNVKDSNTIDNIKNSNGFVTDGSGDPTELYLYERGWGFFASTGYVFKSQKPNPNSGFTILAGIGLLQHKIRIETPRNEVLELTSEYKKGYDRLTNGLAFKEQIGYTYLSNNHLVNFNIAFEFTQAFTQNRRSFNFDTRTKDNTKRLDLLYGIKLSWMLPLYGKTSKEYYYH